ncbi:TonB-dependent receptor SusC [Pedobacter glucosidilyticus]|nr:TonB-dependent receptor [Pedobacter glucosidilyticus]KHJ39418.1 TonB-dependent receptor SusC [Pedobacter glucosidilyticus]
MKRILLIIPLLMAVFNLLAQERNVKGKITEKSNGEPIIGAAVLNVQTKKYAMADVSGSFSIMASPGQNLKVTHLGYETYEYTIKPNDNTISISLIGSTSSLNEVVVTGYQTERKKDLTGAVTVVKVDDIKQLPNNNALQALQGRVPGMVIYTDGSPSGSNTNILIRGVSSINGNAPLLVIDGVPTKAGMHELNPNDIESLQVLKDASSASIYGSRAAAGVIIITTKKAKSGEFQITANARNSISYYANKLSVLDAEGFGKAAWQASANDAMNYGGSPLSNYLVYNYDYSQDASGKFILNKINLPEFLDAANTLKTANTDWFKEISQASTYKTYDVMVSKGTEKGSTVFSLDYTDNDGIVKTTNFRRLSGRLNSDYRLLGGKLLVGENFTINTTREVQGNTLNAALQALPVIPVRTVDGMGWGGPVGGMNDRQNPVRLLEDNKQNHYNYLRILGNTYAELEIMKGLKARTSLGIDYGNFTKRDMMLSYSSGYLNNPITQVNMVNSNTSKVVWTNTLNYKKTFAKHSLDALAGTEVYKENAIDMFASRRGFATEDLDYLYLNAGTGLKDNAGGANEINLLSYFGKVNYVFNDKYLASGTLRYDGSSRFGKNKKFGLFPAFSLGWRLINEDIIKENLPFFSDLKLRYGYGVNGNQDDISSTANRSLYVTNYTGGDPTWRTPDGTAYDIAGAGTGTLPSGYKIVQRSNDDVRWESVSQSNFGLDFGLLNQKIYGSVDYFVKKTSDMLITPAYLAVIGEGGNRTVNGASLKNNGFELMIGYNGKIGSDLNFDITGNIATYRNMITKLPEEVVNSYGGDGLGDNILGRSIGSGYGYVADGLFTTTEQLLSSAEQLNKGLGRIRYKDLNGDGRINEKDQTWIINPTPDFTYGLNINLNYKGFDLIAFFQGVGNQQINVFDVKSQSDFWSLNETGSNKGTRLLNAWSLTNPNSTIPSLTLTDRNFERRFSTYFIENGAYMKLRNLQIGYTLPKNIVEKIKASNIRIYVSGQNLFTVKSKSFTGVDPEAAGFGYPIPTMFTSGIRLSF